MDITSQINEVLSMGIPASTILEARSSRSRPGRSTESPACLRGVLKEINGIGNIVSRSGLSVQTDRPLA